MSDLYGRPCDLEACNRTLDPGKVVWVDIDDPDVHYYCSDDCRRTSRSWETHDWPELAKISEHLAQVYGMTPVSTAWLRKAGAVA